MSAELEVANMGTRGVADGAVDGRFRGMVLVASCFFLLECSSDDADSDDALSEGRSAGAGGAPAKNSASNAGGAYRSDGTQVSSGGLMSVGAGGNTAEATHSLDANAWGGMGGSSRPVATAGSAGHGGVSTEIDVLLGSGGSPSQGGSGGAFATTPAIATGGTTSTGNQLNIGGTAIAVMVPAGGTLNGGASVGGTSGLLSGGANNVAGTVSSSTLGGSVVAGGTHGAEGGTFSAYAGAAWSSGGTTNGGTLAYGGEWSFGGMTSSHRNAFGGFDPRGTAGAAGAAGAAGSAGTFGTVPEPNLLIAFLGDQGNNANADRVLELVKSEGAAAAIHNGDFDYVYNPSAWNSRIDAILGPDYPYFAVVGNHDAAAWDGTNGYASFVKARVARVPEMQCEGDIGVKAICRFRGLFMLQSCVGTNELFGHGNCAKDSVEHAEFLHDALANDNSLWSVCNWHKNQNDMQIGIKPDEVGWSAYRECMFGGALIATGHEHSYSRTLALSDIGNRALGHGAVGAFDELWLFPGQSFVVVSGLGGVGMRAYDAAGHDDDTWWAAQYASNRWLKSGTLQAAGVGTYGALFVRFHVNGDPRLARGYFKDVNGRIADEFTIRVP